MKSQSIESIFGRYRARFKGKTRVSLNGSYEHHESYFERIAINDFVEDPDERQSAHKSWFVLIDASRNCSEMSGVLLTCNRLYILSESEEPQAIELNRIGCVQVLPGTKRVLCVNHMILFTPDEIELSIFNALFGILQEISNLPQNKQKREVEGVGNSLSDYSAVVDIHNNGEQVRWIRLNNLLVVNSILVLAWAAILGASINFPLHKAILLSGFSLPGAILSVLWIPLGRRSSKYLDKLNYIAISLEMELSLHQGKPYQAMESIRTTLRHGYRGLSSSTWIVTWTPLVFEVLFAGMFLYPWLNLYAEQFR